MPSKPPTKAQLKLIELFASYCYLTSSQLVQLTARLRHAITRDFRALAASNHLKSVTHPTERFGENIWFLTQRGWDLARDKGWVQKKVEATDEKSNKNIPHDLVLTNLHIKLNEIYGTELYWTQLHQDCYRRFGKGENDKVNADAFFSYPTAGGFASFFVEVENTGESKYVGHKSSRVRKMEAYAEYAKGHFQKEFEGDDFRVMTLLPTTQAVLNFLGKLQKEGGKVDSRRFWAGNYDAVPALSFDAPLFATPKDVTWLPARRSFITQNLYSLIEA